MIGIQEDVLNMFLVSHFMILISVAVLAIAFSFLLFLKMNQGLIGKNECGPVLIILQINC